MPHISGTLAPLLMKPALRTTCHGLFLTVLDESITPHFISHRRFTVAVPLVSSLKLISISSDWHSEVLLFVVVNQYDGHPG